MKRALTWAASMAALALTSPLNAQDFVITNATVAKGDGSEPMTDASVIVRNGRIVMVGQNVTPDAALPVVDGTGTWVTPGLFAVVTTLGLWDVGAVSESNDARASGSPRARWRSGSRRRRPCSTSC